MDKDVKAIDTGGPAFPLPGFTAMVGGKSETLYAPVDGMTLRDYFAAKAMAGWLATYGAEVGHPCGTESGCKRTAEEAYMIADAMLSERAKAST